MSLPSKHWNLLGHCHKILLLGLARLSPHCETPAPTASNKCSPPTFAPGQTSASPARCCENQCCLASSFGDKPTLFRDRPRFHHYVRDGQRPHMGDYTLKGDVKGDAIG